MAYQRKTRDRWDIETNYGYAGKLRTANTQERMQIVLFGSTGRIWRHTENVQFA